MTKNSILSSLCEIFSTDAGLLSDRLKSFARQNKYLQNCRHLRCQNIFSLLRFTGHSSVFARQNENLLLLSGSPALFVKTDPKRDHGKRTEVGNDWNGNKLQIVWFRQNGGKRKLCF